MQEQFQCKNCLSHKLRTRVIGTWQAIYKRPPIKFGWMHLFPAKVKDSYKETFLCNNVRDPIKLSQTRCWQQTSTLFCSAFAESIKSRQRLIGPLTFCTLQRSFSSSCEPKKWHCMKKQIDSIEFWLKEVSHCARVFFSDITSPKVEGNIKSTHLLRKCF